MVLDMQLFVMIIKDYCRAFQILFKRELRKHIQVTSYKQMMLYFRF